jgi:putative modified peptide
MANNPEPLPGKVVAQLLTKLGSDDVFRELFQEDPAAALKQVGAPDPEGSALCLKVPKLADKEAIKAAHTALTTQLSAQLMQHPPTLLLR